MDYVRHVNVYGGSQDCGAQRQLVKAITGSLVGRLSEQVPDPPERSEGPSEDPACSLRSRAVDKWLNVVLDLNGILCTCEDWKSNRNSKKYNNSSAPHSATVAAIVGMKAVYVRPNCLTFLEELGKIATISVWSSMKKINVESVVNYLFPEGDDASLRAVSDER